MSAEKSLPARDDKQTEACSVLSSSEQVNDLPNTSPSHAVLENKNDINPSSHTTQKEVKQPKWKDLDSIGAVKSIVLLPDREINGARQKRAEWHCQLKEAFDKKMNSVTRQYDELKDSKLIKSGV